MTMTFLKKTLFTLCFGALLTVSVSAKEITTIHEAINISGKQRMLTQRMLADYVMIGMHSSFRNPKEDLAKVMQEFEENEDAIFNYAGSEETKALIKKVQQEWQEVKTVLSASADKSACEQLSNALDQLLHDSNEVVISIKNQEDAKHGEIVDVSGRQRMLSQRIAGLYLMDLWLQNKASKQKLEEAMQQYESAMLKLKSFEKNTEAITQQLSRAEKAYLYIKNMSSVGLSMDRMPALVYKKAHDMFKSMDSATHLYADLMI